MTNESLAQSYLRKARKRLRVLEVLLEESAYSDVVREAQELVELALKGMLRQVGVEPPKWHDVGGMLIEHRPRFPDTIAPDVDRLAAVSGWLRKERELAFYGDIHSDRAVYVRRRSARPPRRPFCTCHRRVRRPAAMITAVGRGARRPFPATPDVLGGRAGW